MPSRSKGAPKKAKAGGGKKTGDDNPKGTSEDHSNEEVEESTSNRHYKPSFDNYRRLMSLALHSISLYTRTIQNFCHAVTKDRNPCVMYAHLVSTLDSDRDCRVLNPRYVFLSRLSTFVFHESVPVKSNY